MGIETGMGASQIIENLIRGFLSNFFFFPNESIPSIFLQGSCMRFGSSDASDVYISQLKSQCFFLRS